MNREEDSMTWKVILTGLEPEEFVYDSLEEAIAGAGRLARESAECQREDRIDREITIVIDHTHRRYTKSQTTK